MTGSLSKTMVVDGYRSTVGSNNLDYLSFLHNHGANAVILGARFASQLEDVFLADQENAVTSERLAPAGRSACPAARAPLRARRVGAPRMHRFAA